MGDIFWYHQQPFYVFLKFKLSAHGLRKEVKNVALGLLNYKFLFDDQSLCTSHFSLLWLTWDPNQCICHDVYNTDNIFMTSWLVFMLTYLARTLQ